LKSIYPGTVVELIEKRGAVIESYGALIQGVWGNGKNTVGTLKIYNADTESSQPSSQIDELDVNSVLFFDSCSSSDMLQMFRDKQIRGLILGSMAAEFIYTAAEFNFPIVVTAGFCENESPTQAQKILSLHEGKEITINAKPWNNLTGNRPEAFIPLSVEGDISQLPDQVQVREGLSVKVIGGIDSGKNGTLDGIEGLSLLPSGLRVRTARIRLGNGNTLSIPIANLAVVG
ncbi:MAG: hypothetical protein U9R58_12375, partial [Chloroflexota bacterium]|nr:hypothetical protein [Chloroflexota bacterium]